MSVTFVGAGPGAVDLITVRGMKKLQQAQRIIYAGSLVNPELLSYASADCEIYDSAKMNLQEIILAICEGVKKRQNVVRLHTGDPSIYGAIREQMEELDKRGISYEVCPGVSSFLGAAASLNKEYTVPELTQSVIVTRAAGRTPVPQRESLESLSSHGCSMALFLSMGQINEVKKQLLSGGCYTLDTPCAIVYKVTWAEEKKMVGTLRNLEKMAQELGVTKTALILVGDFLGERFELSKLYASDFSTEFRKGDGSVLPDRGKITRD